MCRALQVITDKDVASNLRFFDKRTQAWIGSRAAAEEIQRRRTLGGALAAVQADYAPIVNDFMLKFRCGTSSIEDSSDVMRTL